MSAEGVLRAYSGVLIRLLRGAVYSDDRDSWEALITHEYDVRQYLGVIGLDLVINEGEGFAFLRQIPKDGNEGSQKLPTLVVKRQLTYSVTLLCVLLVECLYEFDITSVGDTRLVLSRQDIRDMAASYLKGGTNEAKSTENIDTDINKLSDFGFLKELDGNKFEVRRILKAKIPADTLVQIRERLRRYAGSGAEGR